MKRFVCMALALFLICSLLVPAKAAVNDKGSIEVKVKYEATNVTGGDLIAVRVGYVDSDKNIFRKVTTHAEITGIGESSTVTQMQNFYTAYKSSYNFDVYKAEVKNGTAKFTDIPLGLYLVYQETAASGFGKLAAFLVTVPYEGKLDVSIASKTELKREAQPTPGGSGGTGSSGGQRLPQTGQLIWPIPCMAVAGTLLFALGWWMCFGRKEDSQ